MTAAISPIRILAFPVLLTLGINLGLKRRVWTVQFGLDSGRVTDVTSRFMSQDLG